MKWSLIRVCGFWLFFTCSYAQEDNIGSGRALSFNGVNDYIILDHTYPNVNIPFSVSAWIYLPVGLNTACPIFVTNDNAPIYHGFWFSVGAGFVLCEFGDNTGGNDPSFRHGKQASVPDMTGRWVHVCAVMNSPADIVIYVNGINVGGAPSGGSSLGMVSSYPTDKAKIGYFLSNGVNYFFKGSMDQVTLWNRSISESEVREYMCKKLHGNETGLVGCWTFDEMNGNTVLNKVSGLADGSFVGSPTRVFSGAPIGDRSIYSYPADWKNSIFPIQDGTDSLVVANVTAETKGIHLYEVTDVPSQTGGLDPGKINKPYFGVFLASLFSNSKFGVLACDYYERRDNSFADWTSAPPSGNVKSERGEFVDVVSSHLTPFDLGQDRVLCDSTSYHISTGLNSPTLSFQWNTGATASNIVVHQDGFYKVTVTESCFISSDSVSIFFVKTPVFTLGNDETTCVFEPRTLMPIRDVAGLNFYWNTGNTTPSQDISDFGVYWLTVSDYCGELTDTVKYSKIPIIDISLDLGSDKLLCDVPSYSINSGVAGSDFQIQWSTGEITPGIVVNQTGLYWVKIVQTCEVSTDSIRLTFLSRPKAISFGSDESSCPFIPRQLRPFDDSTGLSFLWQDGSSGPSFQAGDYGTYWVTASNACGVSGDTVKYTLAKIPFGDLPNVITPNGDHTNETFVIPDNLIGLTTLVVINRWGEEVFRSEGYRNDWSASDLSAGVYYLRLTGTCILERKSTLTIIK